MNNKDKLPQVIQDRLEELEKLIEMYPLKIPTTKVAKYLGMDIECLRRAIEQNKIPFALGCESDKLGNRYTYVSSLTFYLWVTSPMTNSYN